MDKTQNNSPWEPNAWYDFLHLYIKSPSTSSTRKITIMAVGITIALNVPIETVSLPAQPECLNDLMIDTQYTCAYSFALTFLIGHVSCWRSEKRWGFRRRFQRNTSKSFREGIQFPPKNTAGPVNNATLLPIAA